MASVEVVQRLGPERLAQVRALTRAAIDADGVRPLSEHVELHLRYGGEGRDRHLLLYAPDPDDPAAAAVLAGYGHLDPTDPVEGSSAEIVVHPALRRRGLGEQLVRAAENASPDGRLRLWAHGDHPAARALAAALGYQEVRQLWQMRRSLAAGLPDTPLPDGVRLRSFRPGEDDAEWLVLNGRAFADHPEQGSWTLDDLNARLKESWFDPDGFIVAERGGAMVGFHWVKVHGEEPDRHEVAGGHGHEPIGEVYVIGVDPDEQGRGLGRALTVAGLRRMRDRGLHQAMLYVEADNAPALGVYRRLGFSHWDTDVVFRRPPGAAGRGTASARTP